MFRLYSALARIWRGQRTVHLSGLGHWRRRLAGRSSWMV